jgi:hypothetical protein
MLVAVAGTKDSPGVTTVAFGLACLWRARGPVLLVEADPDGGVLAARLGIPQEPGLATLAAAGRHEVSASLLASHAQAGAVAAALIVAPSAPSHARAALRAVADGLSRSIAGLVGTTVVIDLGRLDAESPSLPLAGVAGQILFLTRPTLEGADALAVRLAELEGVTDLRSKARIVTVGEGPYSGQELAQVLTVTHMGHLPIAGGAEALWSATDGAHIPRRPLLRALESLANRFERSELSEQSETPQPLRMGAPNRADPASDLGVRASHRRRHRAAPSPTGL